LLSLAGSGESAADVDQLVADDAQTDPTLHAGLSFVATAIQSVASLEQTDAAFASGAPLLCVAEPALFLQLLAFCALGGAIGGRDPPYSAGGAPRPRFVSRRTPHRQ
jgi:hypothetical protein